MASNATHYNNLTPAQPLDKATLNKMVLRSLNLQASFNYERMQAAGWLYCILPGLEKIHADNKDDLKLSMENNLEFFNTHPFLVTFVMGIILSLEQQPCKLPSRISCRSDDSCPDHIHTLLFLILQRSGLLLPPMGLPCESHSYLNIPASLAFPFVLPLYHKKVPVCPHYSEVFLKRKEDSPLFLFPLGDLIS